MSLRGLATLALALAFSLGSVSAQESLQVVDADSVPNWTAPPYWMPLKPPALEKAEEPGLAPEAVAGVPTPALAFTGIAPCRIADTRSGSGFTGQYGAPQITPAGRTITIAGQCGIPGNAEAVSFNFHAVNVTAAGFFVAYPAGGAFPPVAIMAYNQNTPAISNSAVVPLGTSGAITVVAGVTNIDLIIDTNGYYAPQTVVNTVNGLSGAVTLAAGSNVSITPSGNTLTIAATGGGSGWSLTGNAGTTPGTNFLGTTDNLALEIKVNNQRAMRFEPHVATMVPNVIGGSGNNTVTAGVYAATIGGGGFAANLITDSGGTIGGGSGNQAGDNAGTTTDRLAATVCGGSTNTASGDRSTVGGGFNNVASGQWSTIAGGHSNTASAQDATVGGGGVNNASQAFATIAGGNNNSASFYAAVAGGANNNASANAAAIGGGGANTASGINSMIPGGHANTASGSYSFAAGRQANAGHDGAFVWGDSTDAAVGSTAANQFVARARGGFTFYPDASTTCTLTSVSGWNCSGVSDRNAKREFASVDTRATLARLLDVPIQTWSYKGESAPVRHMGPMAQDFAAAYGLGADDKSINPVDANGVALAAIQGLYEIVKEKDAEIDALKVRLSKLEAKIE